MLLPHTTVHTQHNLRYPSSTVRSIACALAKWSYRRAVGNAEVVDLVEDAWHLIKHRMAPLNQYIAHEGQAWGWRSRALRPVASRVTQCKPASPSTHEQHFLSAHGGSRRPAGCTGRAYGAQCIRQYPCGLSFDLRDLSERTKAGSFTELCVSYRPLCSAAA